MKVKLKKGRILPNNWKQCGYTFEDWGNLNNGKSIDMEKVPKLIEDYFDVEESAPSPKVKNKGVK